MRIIDKYTDFYDFWQNVYRDESITFDRTDSFLLTKELMCRHLRMARWNRFAGDRDLQDLLLLQICNTFWLFLLEVTKIDHDLPQEYTLELITTWKNYTKPRCLERLDIITFSWEIDMSLYKKHAYGVFDRSKIFGKATTLTQAINTNNYRVEESLNQHTVVLGDKSKVEKHIPLLKACGIAECVDSLQVYLAFEEYFSLEKTSCERIASKGITDAEKIGNHGFDLKSSFRGKAQE